MSEDAEISIESYANKNRSQPSGGTNSFSSHRYDQAARHLRVTSGTILDVGCHNGVGGKALRRLFPQATLIGLDCVSERIQEAKAVYDRTVLALAHESSLQTDSIDAIIAGELIEHLSQQDALRFIEEAARLLVQGGQIVLTTPNPSYLRLRVQRRSILDDPAHLSEYTARRMATILNDYGFVIQAVKGTGRVSRMIGCHIPVMPIYGSYMMVAERCD